VSGKVIIFSAPSGAGKTTLVQYALRQFPQLEFSVSATSRKPRNNEIDGKDYYFLHADEFKLRIASNDFAEWEEVYPSLFYGTLHSEIQRIWQNGHHVVFDVDVKGGMALKKIFGRQALAIFIMPPSIDVLQKRLQKRATESEDAIKQRVRKASDELSFYKCFDQIIVNDRIEMAKNDLIDIITRFLA